MKARKGLFNPKNNALQRTFRTSWIMKKTSAIFAFFSLKPFSQTRYKEIPINKNRIVHAGAKIQLGGTKKGFCREAYHPEIAGIVKTEPIIPVASQSRIETTNFKGFMPFK